MLMINHMLWIRDHFTTNSWYTARTSINARYTPQHFLISTRYSLCSYALILVGVPMILSGLISHLRWYVFDSISVLRLFSRMVWILFEFQPYFPLAPFLCLLVIPGLISNHDSSLATSFGLHRICLYFSTRPRHHLGHCPFHPICTTILSTDVHLLRFIYQPFMIYNP